MHRVLDLVLAAALVATTSVSAHTGHGTETSFLHRRHHQTPRDDVHALFAKRQNGNYPTDDVNGPTPLPAWVASYNRAQAAGLIPGSAPARNQGGNPVYANGIDTGAGGICSWTAQKCLNGDLVDSPTGVNGVSFDDGPQAPSPVLYQFLQRNNVTATHFMIGSRINDNQQIFSQAIATGGQVAVHTWSHPYMTTMTDMQVLGELGWTMQIISDLGGGRIPSMWRPPYGDVDNRVRAIAKNVFGLQTVIWNAESNDWCLTDNAVRSACAVGTGPQTDADLAAEMVKFANGPKTPGLMILEHELSTRTVAGFVNAYPLFIQNGWKMTSIADAMGLSYYQNARNNLDRVQTGSIGTPMSIGASSAAPSTSTSTTTVAASTAAAMASSSASAARASASAAAAALQLHSDLMANQTRNIGIAAGVGGLALILFSLVFFFTARRRGWCCFGGRRGRKGPALVVSSPMPVDDYHQKEHFYADSTMGASTPSLAMVEPNQHRSPYGYMPSASSDGQQQHAYPQDSQYTINPSASDYTIATRAAQSSASVDLLGPSRDDLSLGRRPPSVPQIPAIFTSSADRPLLSSGHSHSHSNNSNHSQSHAHAR